MTHVVTERCVNCRYVDCAAECPVDCFYLVEEPAMLVIHPDECIDCEACVPACPVHAIYADDELPDPFSEWLEKNAELVEKGQQVSQDDEIEPMETALTLEEIQQREAQRGWDIAEPRNS